MTETPYSSRALVDSVGVNIHLHYDNTAYRDNFALTQRRLLELGVRHTRDGMIPTTWSDYYARHNALGALGLGCTFIAPLDAQQQQDLKAYPLLMRQCFEAYEGPNEPNISGDPNWVAKARTAMANIAAVCGDYPVLAPSFTDEGGMLDFGPLYAIDGLRAVPNLGATLHNYFGGHHPETGGWGDGGYGSIQWNKSVLRSHVAGGSMPITSTETGYIYDANDAGRTTQKVAGRYMPRLILEQFRAGIKKTFIYELFDEHSAGLYGLCEADGTPKAPFRAVQGLLNLLDDPYANPFAMDDGFTYLCSGGVPDLRTMIFEKSGGRIFLAIWLGTPCYDVWNATELPVTPASVGLRFPNHDILATHTWDDDGRVTRVANRASKRDAWTDVEVRDTLTIIELA